MRQVLAGTQGRAPLVELLSQARVETDGEVQVKVRVKYPGGGTGRVLYRIDPVLVRAQVRPGHQAASALWLLAVGVSDYQDANLHAGVQFAAADARSMARLFQERGPRLFRTVTARVLPDREATGELIRGALTTLAGQVAPQNVFVLYLAGHGASLEQDYHFLPADAVYTSTAALRGRSLTSDQFRTLLAAIPAAKTVVLIDTCSAGGFGGALAGRGIGDKDAIAGRAAERDLTGPPESKASALVRPAKAEPNFSNCSRRGAKLAKKSMAPAPPANAQ